MWIEVYFYLNVKIEMIDGEKDYKISFVSGFMISEISGKKLVDYFDELIKLNKK